MGEGGMSTGPSGSAGARPRLGVLLVTSGWFRDVGLQGSGSDTTRARYEFLLKWMPESRPH